MSSEPSWTSPPWNRTGGLSDRLYAAYGDVGLSAVYGTESLSFQQTVLVMMG